MDTDVTFRAATDADWDQIWPIFADVVRAGQSYPFSPASTETQARQLWMSDPGAKRVTYVAERAGQIVATSYIKPNHVGLMSHIANAGWMIAPEARGQGVGRRFGQWILDQAKTLGFTHMQFNAVVSTNTAAVALWQSLGFEIVGTLPDAFDHAEHGLTAVHVMYKRL